MKTFERHGFPVMILGSMLSLFAMSGDANAKESSVTDSDLKGYVVSRASSYTNRDYSRKQNQWITECEFDFVVRKAKKQNFDKTDMMPRIVEGLIYYRQGNLDKLDVPIYDSVYRHSEQYCETEYMNNQIGSESEKDSFEPFQGMSKKELEDYYGKGVRDDRIASMERNMISTINRELSEKGGMYVSRPYYAQATAQCVTGLMEVMFMGKAPMHVMTKASLQFINFFKYDSPEERANHGVDRDTARDIKTIYHQCANRIGVPGADQ